MSLADDLAKIPLLEARVMDVTRLLGVLVERAGGEVTILPQELKRSRNVSREEIGFTGAVVLRSTPAGVPE